MNDAAYPDSSLPPDLSLTPTFLDAVFRYADPDTYCALRVFQHDRAKPPPWSVDVQLSDQTALLDHIARGIHYAATSTTPMVFSPVTGCTFRHPGTAKTRDLAEGLALAVELDQGDTAAVLTRLEDVIGLATVVVRSGGEWSDPQTGAVHAKRHAYWRLSEPTRDEVEHILLYTARRDAARLTGADPTGAALAHCYRWPGSLNRKNPAGPVRCTIDRIDVSREIHLIDAAERLVQAVEGAGLNGGCHKGSSAAYRGKRELQADSALVAAAMECIPNHDVHYNEWVRMAYAVAGATGGTRYDILHKWSRKSSKHRDDETNEVWGRVLKAKVNKIGAGSIFHEAEEHGWIDPRRRPSKAAHDRPSHPSAEPEPESEGSSPPSPLPLDDVPGPEPDEPADEPEPDEPPGAGADPAYDILQAIDQLGPGLTLKELIAIFNKRYAVANEGGKALVIWTTFDPVLSRDRIERASFDDFKKFYCNRKLTVSSLTSEGKPKNVTKSFAEWWLEDPKRCQYLAGVVFAPGGVAVPHTLNLWRGWAIKPAPGDWSRMSAHIQDVICAGRTEISSYVMRWLAYMAQYPGRPGEVAIVMRGLKGVGKGIFGKWLLRLCGRHGLHVINSAHLTGHFTGHLRDVVFVFADEALYAGDKQHEGILKGIVTEGELLIESKYRTPVMAANRLHLLLSSNNDWVVPATQDERRYLVLDAVATHKGDFAYFAALDAQMENGGLAAMLHELVTMDIRDFHPRQVPDTPELSEQKLHSLDSVHRWWMAVLSRGFIWRSRYGHRDFLRWHEFVATEMLNRSYAQWCAEARITYPAHRVAVGKMLAAIYRPSRPRIEHPVYEAESVDSQNPQPVVKLANQHGYRVGTLATARALFRDAIGLKAETSEWDAKVAECDD